MTEQILEEWDELTSDFKQLEVSWNVKLIHHLIKKFYRLITRDIFSSWKNSPVYKKNVSTIYPISVIELALFPKALKSKFSNFAIHDLWFIQMYFYIAYIFNKCDKFNLCVFNPWHLERRN